MQCCNILQHQMIFAVVLMFHCLRVTSSLAIAERPRCRVGQFWPNVEDDIVSFCVIHLTRGESP